MRLEEATTHNSQCKKCGKCCVVRMIGFGMTIETGNRCVYLTKDNLCATYNNRPEWCLSVQQMKELGILPQDCVYRGGV